ncbi:MAG: FAD-dependent oxidoreductase [Patescibacteria group bacterium]|jgi:ferredoxin-NADP reductase
MKQLRAKILNIRAISPTAVEISMVRANGRNFFGFLPGQYATLSFPGHDRLRGERSFSITSAPEDLSTLRFGIRIYGRYTRALLNLRPGDPALVAGPFGQFTFVPARDESAVFLAGGIGITPFLSMIQSAANQRLPNKLNLFYSVKTLSDAPYIQELQELGKINPALRTVFAVSNDEVTGKDGSFVRGRISRDLIAEKLEGDYLNRTYFICGPPPFMKSMKEILGSLGVPSFELKSERFGVGSSAFIERGTPVPKYIFAAWGVTAMILLGVVIRVESLRRANAQTANTVPSTQVNTNASPSISNNQNSNSTNIQQTSPAPVRPIPRTAVS